jgi:myxalamid-type polyketide synthase MxaE and MxaD
VDVEALDVCHPRAVERLVGALDAPLRGVIHAAGVLDDGIVAELDRERFAGVLRPKVLGAWNLHAATAERPLDFFALFSSVVSLLTSPGQANYAAANAFLDALAHARRARGLAAHAINWAPWAEVGMAAGRSFRGVRSLAPAQACDALEGILADAAPQTGVFDLDLRQWFDFFPSASRLPLLSELRARDGAAARRACDGRVKQELLALPEQERVQQLQRHVTHEIARVLARRPDEIGERSPLSDLGFDSLMAIELRNRLEADLAVTLSPTLLFACPTLQSMVASLALLAGLAADGSPARACAEAEPDLDALSEDELSAALAAELADLELSP